MAENLILSCGLRPVDLTQFRPESVPLTLIKVYAEIKTFISIITITQFYKNLGDSPIECEYVFPLDDNGVVTQMIIQFDDGRELTANVEEKKQAEESYQQAVSSGHSAMLARTNEPDKMILNIGNLAPNSKAKVIVIYTSPLSVVNERWKFLIPVAMTPLYNLNYKIQDSDREVTDFPVVKAENVPYTISFTLDIKSSEVIEELESLNHQVNIVYHEGHKAATVTLAQDYTYKPDRDFILSFYTSEAYKPKAILENNEGIYSSMLSFIPKFLEEEETEEDLEGTGEYIFILDRSGSMGGDRITMATQAAALFLKSLPADCKFNIISFGSDFSSMFERSVVYNRENMNRAINEVSRYDADLGGTEILEPINHVLRQESDPQYPRTVFLLTDGEVSSPELVVRVVAENTANTRVHAIGIGEGVSAYLIKEVAKAGKGSYSFVTQNENLHSTVMGALRRTILPALTQWSLNLQADVVPNPQNLSTIYFNEPFVIFARTEQELTRQASIKTFNTKTRQYETFEVTPDDFYNITGNSIEKLWHKHKIRELEHEIDKGKNELKQTVIDISVKYQIPSRYTAYIAVEHRKDPISGELKYVKIPISLTSDSNQQAEMFGGPMAYGMPMMQAMAAPSSVSMMRSMAPQPMLRMAAPIMCQMAPQPIHRMAAPKMCQMAPANIPPPQEQMEEMEDEDIGSTQESFMMFGAPCGFSAPPPPISAFNMMSSSPESQEITLPKPTGYMIIVSLQETQGFWELSSLSGVVSIPDKPQELSSLPDSDEIWATLVALAYLEKDYQDKKQDWSLVQRKAKRWLKTKGVGVEFYELANNLIQGS